jgi:hypothetical protein
LQVYSFSSLCCSTPHVIFLVLQAVVIILIESEDQNGLVFGDRESAIEIETEWMRDGVIECAGWGRVWMGH